MNFSFKDSIYILYGIGFIILDIFATKWLSKKSNPLVTALFFSFPIGFLETLLIMNHEGKSSNFIVKYVYSTFIGIFLSMSLLYYSSQNLHELSWKYIGKILAIYILLSIVIYQIIIRSPKYIKTIFL